MSSNLDNAINKVQICLRTAQMYLMPSVLGNLQKAMKAEKDEQSLAKLALISADVARTCGDHQFAVSSIENILRKPPAGAMKLLSAAKRLRVSLYLDAGELALATDLADTIDALEVESSAYLKKDAAMVVMSKNDEFVDVETWLTLAELYCTISDLQRATASIKNARARLFRDEESLTSNSMSIAERAAGKNRINDCRNQIEFWDLIIRLRGGNAQAREMLCGLKLNIESDAKHDKRLVARVNAVLGDWLIEECIPPTGICAAEANRLVLLSAPSSEIVELVPAERVELSQSQAFSEKSSLPSIGQTDTEIYIKQLLANQLETSKQISELAQIARQSIETSPHTNAAEPVNQSRSLAGGLDKIILPALLEVALTSNLTGYFDMSWSADDVESSVNANLISSRASVGQGFIFIQKGSVIDITLGTYEPPADLKNDAEDAEEAFEIMLQISMGSGLDTQPTGNVFFRHSPAVALRTPRVLLAPKNIVDFFVKLDKKVYALSNPGFVSDEAETDKFEADWEMPAEFMKDDLPPDYDLMISSEIPSPQKKPPHDDENILSI